MSRCAISYPVTAHFGLCKKKLPLRNFFLENVYEINTDIGMSATDTSCACGAASATSCTAGTASSADNKPANNTRTIQNGKGDAPRNIGPLFRQNYDLINWGSNKRKKRITV